MEIFDLSRLNGVSFERLIRAMCFEMMGPSGAVYSSGPDGARDYTFEGEIKGYESRGWNGYLVLQAKFREKLQGGTSDVKWLESQLSNEHKKYRNIKAGLRKPDYYILASNISLSGADGVGARGALRVGGHTKISNVVEKWKKTLGIKDYDLWPADKIVDLLVGCTHVRHAYAAWITPGDVLSSVLKNFSSNSKDFPVIISRQLKESLRRDQYARLKDAGSVLDAPIRVSQVFVDLPIHSKYDEFMYHIEDAEYSEFFSEKGLIARLVERAREILDPISVFEAKKIIDDDILPARNKIVILGGPGQGKSTASMFLAQLFRAALLESDPNVSYDDNINFLIPEILSRAKKEGISNLLPRRYPIFVSLPRFADAISKAKEKGISPPSLLAQIASDISISCDKNIDREDLRNWIKVYPWIVILDGLDEVPASGERHSVLEAIASFNTEMIELLADILLIITTRPQGYNQDLDSASWEHWQLADLPPTCAIAYAEALGVARYPGDPYRQKEVLILIEQATEKPATSRLMISPLQVTIMYLIVDTGGSVPAARWSLFNEYFDILKKREKAKGGENQKILERNWAHLSPIHQRAGLILQVDSEVVGGAVSFLSEGRFYKMVQEYLRTCEYDDGEINSRAKELMSVALDRLVLLSSREEGKISFDVRSLQEFMAAAALTSGREADVECRLTHIAGLSHWRHVFLIGAK